MATDRATVHVGESFHLTIAAHVDERLLELDNVTLPDLSGFDTLGDERRCIATQRGSDCTETLTLASTVAADRTIAATVMDAVDARNGKPSRFASNTVALHVTGVPPHLPTWAGALAWSIVLALSPLVLVAAAAWALIWGFSRTKPRPVAPPPQLPSPIVMDPDAGLRDLVAALAREPSRARALAVRAALRERVGARDDETLADIATRREMADRGRVLAALHAIERASFCQDKDVPHAVGEALPSLNF